MTASGVPRWIAAGTSNSTESDDGPWSKAVVRTLERGSTALADSTASSRDALVILLSHLTVHERVIADATRSERLHAISLTAHHASALRLRRMLQILHRTDLDHGGRAARFDAPTVRRSLIRQLKAHADIERELVARFERDIRPADARAFAETYERLIAEALADPNSMLPARPERSLDREHRRRVALIRATKRAISRRRAFPDGTPTSERQRD